MGPFYVAAADQQHIIDAAASLCLDDYHCLESRPPSLDSPVDIGVLTMVKLDSDASLGTASFEAAMSNLQEKLTLSLPKCKGYLLELHLSIPVLMYLNHAMVESVAAQQEVAETTAYDDVETASPSICGSEEYLPGTLTAWNAAVADRMEKLTGAVREALHLTLTTDAEGDETLVVTVPNIETQDNTASYIHALQESPICSPPSNEQLLCVQARGSQDKTVLLHFATSRKSSSGIKTKLSTSAESIVEPKQSKRLRIKRFCAKCFRCSQDNDFLTDIRNPMSQRRGSMSQQNSITLEYDEQVGAMKSLVQSDLMLSPSDPIKNASELLLIIEVCIRSMLSANSEAFVVLDLSLNIPQIEYSPEDKANIGAVIRRGASWNGDVTDDVTRRLVMITRRQMRLWLLSLDKRKATILWSRRNLMSQLKDKPNWQTMTITPRVLRKGDHLYRRIRSTGALGFVTHHGVYVGDGNVIHYSGNEGAIATLLIPDQKSTKLSKSSIYRFASGHPELIVRQYVRYPCTHGCWLDCELGCENHKAIAWPENAKTMTQEDCQALVFRRRHIMSGDADRPEPWYVRADLAENAVRRAEYAYAIFQKSREDGFDVDNLAVPDEMPKEGEVLVQKSTFVEDWSYPVDYVFPAYNLFRSNCEHFATWCVTSWGFSLQVSGITATLHGALRGFQTQ